MPRKVKMSKKICGHLGFLGPIFNRLLAHVYICPHTKFETNMFIVHENVKKCIVYMFFIDKFTVNAPNDPTFNADPDTTIVHIWKKIGEKSPKIAVCRALTRNVCGGGCGRRRAAAAAAAAAAAKRT